MSEYVKIKRSKNLRFKLVSLMYLIFIVLTMTQIPVAWLKIGSPIASYFNQFVLVPTQATQAQVQDKLLTIENAYLQLIDYQNLKAESPELNSYAKTDAFFITQKEGEKVFALLIELKNSLQSNDEKKRFSELFAADLANGLESNTASTWVNYKFKHTPAHLCVAQLSELRVRIGLLSNEAQAQQTILAEPKLSLLTRYSSMRVGDEAIFQVKGDSLQSVLMRRDERENRDYTLQANGFVFKPRLAGTYLIRVMGKVKSESISVEVLPASFPAKKALPFRICYKGVNYTQSLPLQLGNMQLFCSADPTATLKQGSIQFSPEAEGWCSLLVKNKEGVLFHDSVFVKPLPEPLFLVSQMPNLNCSKQRLRQLGQVTLMAYHPSFKEGEAYGIESFKVRAIGQETKIENIQGNSYTPTRADIAQLQYLVFYDIHYKIGSETKMRAEPILIEIN